MRRILLLILWQFGLLSGTLLFADVVTLKDGRQISGVVESGNLQELHIKVGEQSQTIDIHQVQAIQFSVPQAPPKAGELSPAPPGSAPAQPNNLILSDGTHVTGRWWSIDATDLHFLVNNELQHYSRRDVSALTFGNATLPPPPARSTPPAASAQPPAAAAQPTRAPAPAPAPASAAPAPQPPALPRPSGNPPPAASPRGLSQPEELGMVYVWNGKFLFPLELTQAVEHKSGATQYWEIPAPKSRVRMSEDSTLVFVLRLAKGVDPAAYSLFSLVTVNGSRRTQSQPGRQGGPATWPVDIEINYASTLMTYALRVRDLPAGEYSFSPSNSDNAYCFGVDPSAADQ